MAAIDSYKVYPRIQAGGIELVFQRIYITGGYNGTASLISDGDG
jgi:hypothetical protein